MAAKKKSFTTADEAIDKFFTTQANDEQLTKQPYDEYDECITNEPNDTAHTNDTYVTKVTNKSKHYNERGKRGERFGLLLDERLKEDLRHLSMAKGSKSVNDLIVTILIEYIEREDNQAKLAQYRKLLQD